MADSHVTPEKWVEVLSACCNRRMFISSHATHPEPCPRCGWVCHVKPLEPII